MSAAKDPKRNGPSKTTADTYAVTGYRPLDLWSAYCSARAPTPTDSTLTAERGVQEPSMIEGSFSFGQYMRSIKMNLPAGAGSQFASLSVPGESF